MKTPHYQDDSVTVYHGDCLNILATLPEHSVDAVVTDPPYLLGFMGREWDTRAAHEHLDWHRAWVDQCLRVLKPGGHLLAFGGTRTWHRLAAAIEDAGFEIRDSIAWLYGSGFPKSLDVSKAIDKAAGAEREIIGERRGGSALKINGDNPRPWHERQAERGGAYDVTAPTTEPAKQWQGWGTALKPAFEPIVVARKPLRGTVAANVLEFGTGALNIDGCRVATDDKPSGGARAGTFRLDGFSSVEDLRQAAARGDKCPDGRDAAKTLARYEAASDEGWVLPTAGRWPSNVLLDQHTATQLDKQSGVLQTHPGIYRNHTERGKDGFLPGKTPGTVTSYGDEGGASRFFPTFRYTPKAPTDERPTTDGIAHPTVKPLELMRWLVRLVTPPHGTVLDPFAGTGTTGEAAIHEHKHAILIEREATYLPLIVARLSKPMEVGFDFGEAI